MYLKHNQYCSVYGGDNYFSYGLNAVLDDEILKIKKFDPKFMESRVSVWVLSNINLVDIISFTQQCINMPRVILCSAKYIRIFARLPLFKDVVLIDLKSSIRHIRNVLSLFLKYGNRAPQYMSFSSSPYLSLRQQDIATLFLRGHAPAYCAKVLNISVKTVSNHKRSLMRNLNVRSDQELMTALIISEHFSRMKSINYNFIDGSSLPNEIRLPGMGMYSSRDPAAIFYYQITISYNEVKSA